MQILTVVLKAKQGGDKVTLKIESEGTVRLDDFAKFTGDVNNFLKTFERSQTGSNRAYKQWVVDEMSLNTIEAQQDSTEG